MQGVGVTLRHTAVLQSITDAEKKTLGLRIFGA